MRLGHVDAVYAAGTRLPSLSLYDMTRVHTKQAVYVLQSRQ